MSVTAEELRNEWFKVSLIRGIPLKYKNQNLIFPVVYMRESHMADQAVFNKVSGESMEQSNEASKKLFTLVTRVIAGEGYKWEDRGAVEAIGKADRKIKPLERKYTEVEDVSEKKEIELQIADLRKGLSYPKHPCMGDEEVLMFIVDCFKTEQTRTVDFVRLTKAFTEINLLADEEFDTFLTLPVH